MQRRRVAHSMPLDVNLSLAFLCDVLLPTSRFSYNSNAFMSHVYSSKDVAIQPVSTPNTLLLSSSSILNRQLLLAAILDRPDRHKSAAYCSKFSFDSSLMLDFQCRGDSMMSME
jgi:hypothetical protein